jgi:hypothetical protein
MNTPTYTADDESVRYRPMPGEYSGFAVPSPAQGAVSWGAIFAGAAGAAALSLILLILGTGLGLSSVSPWAGNGISAETFGVSTIVWITFTQLAASGMGGYLAGRLRTRWTSVQADEVYFRDTAHGFLAWAVASLVTAAALTSAVGAIVSGGAQVGASVAGGAVATAGVAAAGGAAAMGKNAGDASGSPAAMGYWVDTLFRKDAAAAAAPTSVQGTASAGVTAPTPAAADGTAAGASPNTLAEVSRIFVNSARTGTLPPADARYAGQLVAQRTGLSQQDAEKRVNDTFASLQAKAKEAEIAAMDAAEKARKASAYAALWLFVSLLAGAFMASLMATFGGRQRDL